MMLFLAATGLAGFLASVLLHAAGLSSMGLRYPLAVGIAYGVFLVLLSLFVAYHRSSRKQVAPGSSGELDIEVDSLDLASDSFDSPATAVASSLAADASGSAQGSGSGGGSFSLGGNDGDGLIVLVVVVLVLVAVGSAVFATFFVLIQAPALLAEALVDGVLLVGLARRIDARRAPHWVEGVIRRTFLPVLAVAVCFAVVGFSLEYFVPGATTMGEVLRRVGSR
jgi:hypothetical protein